MGRKLGKPLIPQIERLCDSLGVARDLGALADRLQLPYTTVRNWQYREHVPALVLHEAAQATKRSVESFFASNTLELERKRSPRGIA